MKYIILICCMFLTLQLLASDHEDTKDSYEDWLWADGDDEGDDSLDNFSQQPATKKQKLNNGSAQPQPIPEPPSQAPKVLPSSSTTRHSEGQKAPRFLDLFKAGLITAEQIQQCIQNKPTTSPKHDEEFSEHYYQDLVCLWAGCMEDTPFPTAENLHNHLKSVHSEKLRRGDDNRFHCSFNNCNNSYTVKENLIHHFSVHSGMRFSCQECGQYLKNELTLRQHRTKLHDHREENSFTCEDCGTNIIGKNNFQRHINAVHKNIRPFPCEFEGCNQIFKTKAHLDVHATIHTGKRFSCPQCSSTFSHRSALSVHIKDKHSQDSPLTYDCDICEKSFSNKQNLKRHKKDVHHFHDYGDE